jgi:crossover junction endodeoxyribonuclease RuvC
VSKSGVNILGIDPGLRSTGWGVIRLDGHRLNWIADGMIKPDPRASDETRLLEIETSMTTVLEKYQPHRACIEEIFVAKNPASALKLGMARGAALVAVARFGLPLLTISARRVKQNVTGSGRADKDQITAMVSRLLNFTPSGVDAADALAIAIAATNDQNDHVNITAPRAAKGASSALDAAIQKALEKESQS